MPSHQSGKRVFWLMQEGGGVLSLFACFGALVCSVMLGALSASTLPSSHNRDLRFGIRGDKRLTTTREVTV